MSFQNLQLDLQKHLELSEGYSENYLLESKWVNESTISEILSSERKYGIELLPFEVKVFEIIPLKEGG